MAKLITQTKDFYSNYHKHLNQTPSAMASWQELTISGTSSRHLQALSEILVAQLKRLGIDNCRIEGKDSNDWKLVDAQDIIVHIFHPEKREFYDLEKMWSEETPKEKAMI